MKSSLWLKGALPCFHPCHMFSASEYSPKQDSRCRISSMKWMEKKKQNTHKTKQPKKQTKPNKQTKPTNPQEKIVFKFAVHQISGLIWSLTKYSYWYCNQWLKGGGPQLLIRAYSKFKSTISRGKLYSEHPKNIVSYSIQRTLHMHSKGMK